LTGLRNSGLRRRAGATAAGVLAASALVGATTGLAAGAARPPAAAHRPAAHHKPAPAVVAVPAHFVYLNTSQGSNCAWGIGIEFQAQPRAVAYTVSYYDGFYHRQERQSATLSELKGADLVAGRQGAVPRGRLFIGVIGGTSRLPCDARGDASGGGRFGKDVRAWARLGRFRVSGAVVAERCTRRGCKRRPRARVTVVAKAQGAAGGGRARTDKSGHYSLALPPGTYKLWLRGGAVPAAQLVLLDHAASGVDFRTCGGPRRASCEGTLDVAVSDLAGAPLPGVRVLARVAGPAGASADAAATTGAGGRARLPLYPGSWQVFLARSLGAIEPAGTLVRPADSDPTLEVPGTFYTYTSGCSGGRPRAGGGCSYHLGSAGASGAAQMSARLDVAPIQVSLAHGLGGGTVLVQPAAGVSADTLQWDGSKAPRNRVRLEEPLRASTTLDVLAFQGQADAAPAVPVRFCRPGAAASTVVGPACVLSLSPGAGPGGAAAFNLP
jgi:hypothetical protein